MSGDRPDDPATPEGHTPEGHRAEGHTPEAPAADELGAPGTPGAGLTAAIPHSTDAELVEEGDAPADPVASVAHHDPATHMDAHTTISDDDHGHAEPRLGPIDWPAWGYALVGIAAGLLVVVAFRVAIS